MLEVDSAVKVALNIMEIEPGSSNGFKFLHYSLALEFFAWFAVVLFPFLRVVNGAAVTQDQFGIQITLFASALILAVGLRIFNYLYH